MSSLKYYSNDVEDKKHKLNINKKVFFKFNNLIILNLLTTFWNGGGMKTS